jgi:ERF superfamily
MIEKLLKIQQELKVPKNRTNTFGGYKYRSCEDIVDAVKPLAAQEGFYLILTDEVVEVGGRIYVKATAKLLDGKGTHYEACGYARESETKKGMDEAQITGSASSYARKYALNGLFAIDDVADPDATNTHDKDKSVTPTIKKDDLDI